MCVTAHRQPPKNITIMGYGAGQHMQIADGHRTMYVSHFSVARMPDVLPHIILGAEAANNTMTKRRPAAYNARNTIHISGPRILVLTSGTRSAKCSQKHTLSKVHYFCSVVLLCDEGYIERWKKYKKSSHLCVCFFLAYSCVGS